MFTRFKTLQDIKDAAWTVSQRVIVPDKDYPTFNKIGVKYFQKTDEEVDMDMSIGLRPMEEFQIDLPQNLQREKNIAYKLKRGAEHADKIQRPMDDMYTPPKAPETKRTLEDAALYDATKKRHELIWNGKNQNYFHVDKPWIGTPIPTEVPMQTGPRIRTYVDTAGSVETFIAGLSFEPVRTERAIVTTTAPEELMSVPTMAKIFLEKQRPEFQDGFPDPAIALSEQEKFILPKASQIVEVDDIRATLANFDIASVSSNLGSKKELMAHVAKESDFRPTKVASPSLCKPYSYGPAGTTKYATLNMGIPSQLLLPDKAETIRVNKTMMALPKPRELMMQTVSASSAGMEGFKQKEYGTIQR